MGLLVPQNLFGGAGLHEQLQHFPVSSGRILYGGIQLSVGEGTRAALPELNIALGIQGSSGPEGVHLLFSHGGLVASLQDKRLIAGLCQQPGAEQPRRTASGNHRPVGKLFRTAWGELIGSRRRRDDIAVSRFPGTVQQLPLAGGLDVHRAYIEQLRLFPGVHGPADQLPGKKLFPADFQDLKNLPLQTGLLKRKRYFYLRNSNHTSLPPFLAAARPATAPLDQAH